MTVPEKGPGGGVIGFCTPVREILRPNQGIISPYRRRHLSIRWTPTQCPGPGRARAAERCATGCWPRQPCWYARAAAERCGWPRRALRLRLRGAASSAEAHTHCCADRCDTRRWPHVLSCACIAAQSRAAMVRRLSVWTNRASVSPLIAIRSV